MTTLQQSAMRKALEYIEGATAGLLAKMDAIESLRTALAQQKEGGGCTLAGTGRGDCWHSVGLPGMSISGQHDGHDDTVDAYGKPNGWCWQCWKSHKIAKLEAALAQQGEQQPVAYAAFADNGNIRIWTSAPNDVQRLSEQVGFELMPLYTAAPAPQAQPICKLFGTLPVYDSPAPQPAQGVSEDDAAKAVNEVMEQAQVFASAWSLVGGQFDNGNAMDDADEAKAELRTMVVSLARAALQSAQPEGGNQSGKQQLPPLPTTELDALGCAYCNHPLFLGSKCKNCGKEVK